MPWYFYQRSWGISVPALASRLQEAHAEGDRWPGSQAAEEEQLEFICRRLNKGPLAERDAADISRCVYATCRVCHRYIRNRRALAHGRFAIFESLK